MALRVHQTQGRKLIALDEGYTLRKLAEGRRGVVLVVNEAYVLKLACSPRNVYNNIDAQEACAAKLLWFTLAHTGVSPHVVRPLGSVSVAIDRATQTALAFEWLRGVRGAPRVKHLRGLLRAHLRATLADDDATFHSHFRAALFQTLYTLAAAGTIFRGKLRLNDCHDKNVGVTEWKAAAGYEVLFPLSRPKPKTRAPCHQPSGDAETELCYVARHFVVPCAVRATLLDFGYVSLCGDTTCGHDARFSVPALAAGMCGDTPSAVYDSCTLLYSLRQLCNKPKYSSHARAVEFSRFYTRVCNDFHAQPAYRSAMPGRLALSTQRAMATTPTMRVAMGVQTPLEMLRDEYFAPFRAADLCAATEVFGLRFATPLTNLETLGACSAKAHARASAALAAFADPALALVPPARAGTRAGEALERWLGPHSKWTWCAACNNTACSVLDAEPPSESMDLSA